MQKSRYEKDPLRLLPVLPAPIARAGPELPEVEIARRVIAEHALRPENADRLYHALHAALRSAIACEPKHHRRSRKPGNLR